MYYYNFFFIIIDDDNINLHNSSSLVPRGFNHSKWGLTSQSGPVRARGVGGARAGKTPFYPFKRVWHAQCFEFRAWSVTQLCLSSFCLQHLAGILL